MHISIIKQLEILARWQVLAVVVNDYHPTVDSIGVLGPGKVLTALFVGLLPVNLLGARRTWRHEVDSDLDELAGIGVGNLDTKRGGECVGAVACSDPGEVTASPGHGAGVADFPDLSERLPGADEAVVGDRDVTDPFHLVALLDGHSVTDVHRPAEHGLFRPLINGQRQHQTSAQLIQ